MNRHNSSAHDCSNKQRLWRLIFCFTLFMVSNRFQAYSKYSPQDTGFPSNFYRMKI